ncbi:unnamed protein product [Closterium sp. NIES-54]
MTVPANSPQQYTVTTRLDYCSRHCSRRDPTSRLGAIRLGLPIHQLMVAGKCISGMEFKDPSDPHHALRCKHQYAPSRVHDAVKLVVARIAKASGGVVTVEDDTLLAGKRVDVAVRRPMDGEAHALEVSVVDPVSLSVQQHGQCGRTAGYAAKERERRKAVDYHPFLQRHKGVCFVLLILETWGYLGGVFVSGCDSKGMFI